MAAAGPATMTMAAIAAASDSKSLLIELLPTVRATVPLRHPSPAARYLSLAQSQEYAHTAGDLSRRADAPEHRGHRHRGRPMRSRLDAGHCRCGDGPSGVC